MKHWGVVLRLIGITCFASKPLQWQYIQSSRQYGCLGTCQNSLTGSWYPSWEKKRLEETQFLQKLMFTRQNWVQFSSFFWKRWKNSKILKLKYVFGFSLYSNELWAVIFLRNCNIVKNDMTGKYLLERCKRSVVLNLFFCITLLSDTAVHNSYAFLAIKLIKCWSVIDRRYPER